MSLQSILNGDTTPKGERAELARLLLNNHNRSSGPTAMMFDREQDVLQVFFGDNRDRFFRVQVLFDNPHETVRIKRPLTGRVEAFMNLLKAEGFRVREAGGMIDVIVLEDRDRIFLLDCYLFVTPEKVL